MHSALQPDALHRLPHHSAHGAAMPHRLEPVHRRGTAQHTDVFVVHPQQLVPAQPQREHPRLGKGRKRHGVSPQLVEDRGDLCAGGVIHALILFQQGAHKIIDLDGRVG